MVKEEDELAKTCLAELGLRQNDVPLPTRSLSWFTLGNSLALNFFSNEVES